MISNSAKKVYAADGAGGYASDVSVQEWQISQPRDARDKSIPIFDGITSNGTQCNLQRIYITDMSDLLDHDYDGAYIDPVRQWTYLTHPCVDFWYVL